VTLISHTSRFPTIDNNNVSNSQRCEVRIIPASYLRVLKYQSVNVFKNYATFEGNYCKNPILYFLWGQPKEHDIGEGVKSWKHCS